MIIKLISQMMKWGLNEFPIAVVMNNHIYSDFKQHRLIILQFWRSEV